MISISAVGRLAYQPELKMIPGGGRVCEFRILDSRFHKGQDVTEAVTFFCFDDMAEEFCSATVKGQEISATGTQETQTYTPPNGGTSRTYVKYRLTWYRCGRKPYTGDRSQGQGTQAGSSQGQRVAPSQNGAPIGVHRSQPMPQAGHQNVSWQPGNDWRQQTHNHHAQPAELGDEFSHSGFEPSASDEPGFLP